ncbi:Cation efflux protein family and Cation efflux protein transmembrane domain-containing protein [Strongyloides ratti]|uniref:Cation efflux protein family and Cation efflux protein transmembrane domain-containing protein n=1 Tax=Strongyloides ratti TaxID=34506 RepID=A0A090L8F6_STRRB|nr:Cation efflux protein family and Cation efflux protein transmembrane domain-containing protein [Strongyloides ratti]CEF66066.1 Cation efflux protein family and Cation efflux protein transmembrane domain-containing protein [Strongyloides ratti]
MSNINKEVNNENREFFRNTNKNIREYENQIRRLQDYYNEDLLIIEEVKRKYMLTPRKSLDENAENDLIFNNDKKNEDKIKKKDNVSKSLEKNIALITLLINITLIISKSVASYLSGSFSILSTVVDSAVDITAGLVIWLTTKTIKIDKPYSYPRGRNRLEPLALIIVSIIMGIASLQIIIQSIKSIIEGTIDPQLDKISISIMISTIIVKLSLYLACYRFSSSQSIQILAMDHRNDCISNFFALLCAALGKYLIIYADPIGAVLVSIFIAKSWLSTGLEHSQMLVGRSGDGILISRVINVTMNYHEDIKKIEKVFVYHIGVKFLVEVYVKLDSEMTLRRSDSILQGLQEALEGLEFVERAFVLGEPYVK